MKATRTIFWLYARYRLRWYLVTSGRALVRHWQWLLLAALIVPGVPVLPLFTGAARGLAAIVSPQADGPARLALLVGLAGLAVGWVLMQRRSVSGGSFPLYATTLPIAGWMVRLVDLVVLMVADVFGLIVFALAVREAGDAGHGVELALLLVVNLMLQTLALRVAPNPRCFRGTRRLRLPPALGVQLGIFGMHKLAISLRLLTVACIAWGAVAMVDTFGRDLRAAPVAIAATALIVLPLSGLFRLLQQGHAPMRAYFTTLPLPAAYWPIRDSGLVLLLGAVAMAPLAVALFETGAASLPGLAELLAGGLVLLLVLRWPSVGGGRSAPFLGALLAAGWAGAAIAAVVR